LATKGRDPTPPPFAIRTMTWFAVDRLELAPALGVPGELRDHALASLALERWITAYRKADSLEALMKREGRYRSAALSEAEMRAEAPLWLEAQWEVLLFDLASERQVYRGPWSPPEWDRVAADLARAIGLPFLRDAARRGLFGFRPQAGLLGFLTLREVRETLKSWRQFDPTRLRGTSLRLPLVEEIQGALRAVSQQDREMVICLV